MHSGCQSLPGLIAGGSMHYSLTIDSGTGCYISEVIQSMQIETKRPYL